MEWNTDATELLDELLKPIPVFVRPMAKKKIDKYIINAADGNVITKEAVVKGYLQSSEGDMRERAIKVLKAKGINVEDYLS